jgi:RecA-family ATPase
MLDTLAKLAELNGEPLPADEPNTPLAFVDMSNWDHEPVPTQDWAVLNRIPLRQCVLFSGEGAAGKSTVQLHLCSAHVLARDWLGTMPQPGPALYFDAEDDEPVIHRRLAAVCEHYKIKFADLIEGGLNILSFAGKDAMLATASRNGRIEETTIYKQLLQAAADIKPKMIGIASCANVFAGNENDRPQVQQFVGLLTRLAMAANGSVVLISHPSLHGISSDSGLSGSTQWHNAVRARFFMKGVNPESGEQPDGDLREIVFKKNQYGPVGENIVLRWTNGMFLPVPGISSLDRAAMDAKADQIFVALLTQFSDRGENISPKRNAHMFAPVVFAKDTAAKTAGLKRKHFEDAMARLFESNKIHLTPYGPRCRDTQKLAPGSKP